MANRTVTEKVKEFKKIRTPSKKLLKQFKNKYVWKQSDIRIIRKGEEEPVKPV